MKAVFLFVSFITFSFLGHAQKTDKASFGFGTGLNVSTVDLNTPGYSLNPTSLTGFRGYIFIDAPLGKNFFIQPELAYDGMGWQYYGDDNNAGGQLAHVKTYLNYITFAVLPKYRIENTGLAFYIGPYCGFLLNAKMKGFEGETHDDKKDYTDGNFGGIVGAEYYLPMGLGFSARYMAGISNIISEAQPGESMHTYVFSFSIAYKLYH
jgi:hypothetical protein